MIMAISNTVQRVPAHTADHVNQKIARETLRNVSYFGAHPELISKRLAELDREWDIERVLETGASIITLTGLTLGITANRKWLALPVAVQLFFLQHALQGWCPPLPLFRRLGFRTQSEIEQERYALKVLRGDFAYVHDENVDPNDELDPAIGVLEAARRSL